MNEVGGDTGMSEKWWNLSAQNLSAQTCYLKYLAASLLMQSFSATQ